MDKSTALVSTLLFAAVAVAASAVLRPSNDVSAACDYVTVPQLCTALISKTAPATVRDLTLASIRECMATTDNAKATAARVKLGPKSDENLKAGIDVCTRVFNETSDALQKASVGMDADDNYDSVVNEVTAALTFVGACDDVFSENPGLVFPVADDTSMLKKLIGNSLCLSVALQVQSRQAKRQQKQ